jgi:hypothetical protein
MQLPDAFDKFHDAISLGAKPTQKIETASGALITYLGNAYGLPPGGVFLQGSYPNGTAVEPADEQKGEYDADLVCVCATDSASPDDALNDLEAKLAQHGTYAELLKREGARKKPCVRLRYADDEVGGFHVDVVPARASTSDDPDAPLEVPRRGEDWHDTAPTQYTDWCHDRGLRFARTVKMLKRWREEHQSARTGIKSIVLQVLAANNLGAQDSDAEALAATLQAIKAVLDASPDRPPRVANPVLPAEDLAARWTQTAYQDFRRELDEAVDLARRALNSTDEAESHELWRELLGEDFPPVPTDKTRPVTAPPGGVPPIPPPPPRPRPKPRPDRGRTYGGRRP